MRVEEQNDKFRVCKIRPDLFVGFGSVGEADDLLTGAKILLLELGPALITRNSGIEAGLSEFVWKTEKTEFPLNADSEMLAISCQFPCRSLDAWLAETRQGSQHADRLLILVDFFRKLEGFSSFFFPWMAPSAFVVGSDNKPRLIGMAIDYRFDGGEPAVHPTIEPYIQKDYWLGRKSKEINYQVPDLRLRSVVIRHGLLEIIKSESEPEGTSELASDPKMDDLGRLHNLAIECNNSEILNESTEDFYKRWRHVLQRSPEPDIPIIPRGPTVGAERSLDFAATRTAPHSNFSTPRIRARPGWRFVAVGAAAGLIVAVAGFWGFHRFYGSHVCFTPWTAKALVDERDKLLSDVALRRWASEPDQRQDIEREFGPQLFNNINYRYMVAVAAEDEKTLSQLCKEVQDVQGSFASDDPRRPRFTKEDASAILDIVVAQHASQKRESPGTTSPSVSTNSAP